MPGNGDLVRAATTAATRLGQGFQPIQARTWYCLGTRFGFDFMRLCNFGVIAFSDIMFVRVCDLMTHLNLGGLLFVEMSRFITVFRRTGHLLLRRLADGVTVLVVRKET